MGFRYSADKNLGPQYFIRRAFFKRPVDGGKSFTIPKIDRELMDIGSNSIIDVAIISRYDEIQTIELSDISLSREKTFQLPEDEYEDSFIARDLGQVVERVEKPEEDVRQFVVKKREGQSERLSRLKNLVEPRNIRYLDGPGLNKKFFFNRAISKQRISEVGGSLILTIPKAEREAVGISQGDTVNLTLVDARDIPLRKRSVFRRNVISGGRVTIPKERAKVGNYDKGDIVQVIAKPARLG